MREPRPPQDWSELVDPETGQLAPKVPLDALWVPWMVDLTDGDLHFDWRSGFSHVQPPSGLLNDFLNATSDAAILRIAKTYGPLGIYDPNEESRLVHHYRGPVHGKLAALEPLDLWRGLRAEFGTLLSLVAQLREGRQIRDETCQELEQLGIIPPEPRRGRLIDLLNQGLSLEVDREAVVWNTDVWSALWGWRQQSPESRRAGAASLVRDYCMGLVRRAGLRPALDLVLHDSGMTVDLVFQDAVTDKAGVGLSVFGALTVQFLSVTTGAGFAICSSCGRAYAPKRRPSVGRRRYCPDCGRKAAVRDAKAADRARRRKRKQRTK